MTDIDIDIPKPGPVTPDPPVRVLPIKGAGTNRESVEARSRIVALLLSYGIKNADDLLLIAEWIELGTDVEVPSDKEAT